MPSLSTADQGRDRVDDPVYQVELLAGAEIWGSIFADDGIASAILDRLLHHPTTINIKGESYRLRHIKKAAHSPPDPKLIPSYLGNFKRPKLGISQLTMTAGAGAEPFMAMLGCVSPVAGTESRDMRVWGSVSPRLAWCRARDYGRGSVAIAVRMVGRHRSIGAGHT